jgi:hypothetical protein
MMEIIKYNATKGEAAAKVVGGTQVTTGADYSSAINDLSDATAKNSSDISAINKTLSGLDGRFIKHGGDDDTGLYDFGRVSSDDFFSPNYFADGAGFRAYFGSNGYEVNVRDIGDTTIPLATTTGTSIELTGDTQLTVQLNDAFILANEQIGARVLFRAGLNSTPTGATIISEQAYAEHVGVLRSSPGTAWIPLSKEGDDWLVPLATDGRQYAYNIYYECTVRYTGSLSVYAAAKIYGSVSDGTTRYYGGGYKLTTIKADSIVVEDGINGIKITPTGILKTTDGGSTWAPYP